MSFLASFRSDQILSQLVAEPDPQSANAQKLVDKLKKAGSKAVPKIIDALALSDKTHTMVLVDILGSMVTDKNLDMYREGLADGNERVVSGTAWALSSSTDYNPNSLLDFFDDDEVSKPALIEVLRVHKQDLSVHELMQRAYDCEPKEKAAIFKIIEDTIKPDMVPDLIARMGGKDPVIKMHLMNLLARFDDPRINQALEQIHQVHLDDGVLAAHASDQVRNHVGFDRVFNDLEDCGLFLGLAVVGALQQLVDRQVLLVNAQDFDQRWFGDFIVIEKVEQGIRVVIGAAGQRPGCAGNNAFVAVRKALPIHVEILVVDHGAENVYKHHCVGLVRQCEGVDDLGHGLGAGLLEFVDEFLRIRRLRIRLSDKLRQYLIRPERGEEAHARFLATNAIVSDVLLDAKRISNHAQCDDAALCHIESGTLPADTGFQPFLAFTMCPRSAGLNRPGIRKFYLMQPCEV